MRNLAVGNAAENGGSLIRTAGGQQRVCVLRLHKIGLFACFGQAAVVGKGFFMFFQRVGRGHPVAQGGDIYRAVCRCGGDNGVQLPIGGFKLRTVIRGQRAAQERDGFAGFQPLAVVFAEILRVAFQQSFLHGIHLHFGRRAVGLQYGFFVG